MLNVYHFLKCAFLLTVHRVKLTDISINAIVTLAKQNKQNGV